MIPLLGQLPTDLSGSNNHRANDMTLLIPFVARIPSSTVREQTHPKLARENG
jgi:hypothetical protein